MAIPICDLDKTVDRLFEEISFAVEDISREGGNYLMQNLMYRMLKRSITIQRGGLLPIEEEIEEEEDDGWPPIQESDQPPRGD